MKRLHNIPNINENFKNLIGHDFLNWRKSTLNRHQLETALTMNLTIQKDFKKTNILMGANRDEGIFFILYYMADIFKKEEDVFINRDDFIRSITELNIYANPLQK